MKNRINHLCLKCADRSNQNQDKTESQENQVITIVFQVKLAHQSKAMPKGIIVATILIKAKESTQTQIALLANRPQKERRKMLYTKDCNSFQFYKFLYSL